MTQPLKYMPLAAALALSAPVAAQDGAAIYEGGVNCGALHSFMSAALEGQDDALAKQYADSATRFLYLALVRDEANAESDLMQSLDALITRVESFGEDDQAISQLVTSGAERCEAFRETVAEEYAAVDLSE